MGNGLSLLAVFLLFGLDICAAMLVLALWARPESTLRALLRRPRLGTDWFEEEPGEESMEQGRRLLERLRIPMLLALFGISFACGVLAVWLRVLGRT